jgi:hypothetical protein
MELWQFYQHVWEAERALSAAVPTAWLVKGGVAFAVVKFPQVAEPGEWWAEKTWIATPWVFGSGLFGIEVAFEDARFTAIACPMYATRFVDMEEVHILLNTEPIIGFKLHDEAVQWLRGWASALSDEEMRRRAVERTRSTEYCR